MIEPVPHEERARGVEPDERRLQLQVLGDMLVQQGTNLQTPRVTRPQQRYQPVQRLPRINDILDQEDMFPRKLGFGVVQQPNVAARRRALAIARGHEEIDLQRPIEPPHQVAQEDEAPLEQAEDQEVSLRVGGSNLRSQLSYPPRDRFGVEHDPRELRVTGLLQQTPRSE